MRSVRKFWLKNSAGELYSLNGEANVWSTSWAGLGYSASPSYADLNHGFYLAVSEDSEPQGNPTCTLVFTSNAPYADYTRFCNWLAAAGTLTLVYKPASEQAYYRDIKVNFVQKGELNPVGWLEVPCSFLSTTQWYLPQPTELALEAGGTDESKRYDYEYTEALIYGADSSAALSGSIHGAGHVPGSLLIRYYGAITNPKIRLTGDVSGKTFGVCALMVVLAESDTLEVSTRYEDSYARRISASGAVTDLLDVLDITTTPFFHVPVDEPCTLSIEADAAFTGRADLLVYYYFRSV